MLRIQIKYLLEIYWVQGSMTKVEELLQVWGTFSASLNLQNSHKFVNQKALWASWSLLAKTKSDSDLPTSEDLWKWKRRVKKLA